MRFRRLRRTQHPVKWYGLLIAGIGSGLLIAPATAAAVNSVPPQQAGMASSAVNMFRQLGSVLGPAVLGTIVTTRFPHNLSDRLAHAGVPAAASRQIVEGAGVQGPAPAAGPHSRHGGVRQRWYSCPKLSRPRR